MPLLVETVTGRTMAELRAARDAAHQRLPHRLCLFYSNRRPEDAAFLAELRGLGQANPNFRLIAAMTEPEKSAQPWAGETGFIRREMFEPTTLLLYAAFAAQVLAQALDVDDTLLSTRHPIFRYPLEEPCELLANLLLASGLLLKYCRDWRRAGRPAV